MKIRAFRALRPASDKVEQVASVPYDTINSDEARELAVGRPWSFLHVIRPEIDLPRECDVHDDAVYDKGAENFRRFQDEGALVREEAPCLYLYRQRMGEHVQRGIVSCCHVDAYDQNRILKHEKTRQDKEDDRTRHVKSLMANAGPIFLTYRDSESVDQLVDEVERQEPLYHIESPDGVVHTVWRIARSEAMITAFESVPCAYIADGHHRAAAAARTARELRDANANHTGDEEYNWFLAVLFQSGDLTVLPYNRVVRDLNGMTEETFLEALGRCGELVETDQPEPDRSCTFGVRVGGKWWMLAVDEGTVDWSDSIASLDVSILQDRVLTPLLGIGDPRTDERIEFVGGIRGMEELERRAAPSGVAFALHATSMDQLLAVSDDSKCMPPKSTWFEPKLRSGLFVHAIDSTGAAVPQHAQERSS